MFFLAQFIFDFQCHTRAKPPWSSLLPPGTYTVPPHVKALLVFSLLAPGWRGGGGDAAVTVTAH